MKLQTTIIAILAIMSMACSQKPTINPEYFTEIDGKQIPLIRIDLAPDSAEVIGLSALFEDVEMIPLETSDNCLIMNTTAFFSNNSLVLATQSGGLGPVNVLEFGLDGSFIKQIGGRGKGPGEHVGYMMMSGSYHPDMNMMLLQFLGQGPELQLFQTDGQFIKKVKNAVDMSSTIAMIDDDLFINPGSISGRPNYERDSIFLVWQNTNGEVLKSIPRQSYPPSNNLGYTPNAWGPSMFQFEGKCHLYNPGNDTIFTVEGMTVKPRAILKHSDSYVQLNQIIDTKEVIGTYSVKVKGENKDYLIFEKSVITVADLNEYSPGRWGGMFDASYSMIINKKSTGDLHNIRLKDDILNILAEDLFKYRLNWDPSGRVYMLVPALGLTELIDKGIEEQSIPASSLEKVKTLRSQIDEESNPILFIFKERAQYQLGN